MGSTSLVCAEGLSLLSVLLFLAGNAEALAAFPQAFAAYSQLFRKLGFIHRVLMLNHESLEIVF